MNNFTQFFILTVKGIIVGIANIIPGVSGGTLAVTLGIYAPLVDIIGHLPQRFKDKKLFAKDASFLLPIMLGIILAILIFSKIISLVLVQQPVNSQLFFVGLIVGSLPLLIKLGEFRKHHCWSAFLSFLAAAALMLFFLYFEGHSGQDSGMQQITNKELSNPVYLSWLGVCGFFAATAMVVPGISGSLLLVMLGAYGPVLQLVSNLSSSSAQLGFGYTILGLVVFVMGICLGIILCARFVDWLIKKYRTNTMAFILGLVLFSILAIWPSGLQFSGTGVVVHLLVLLGGAAAAYGLGR